MLPIRNFLLSDEEKTRAAAKRGSACLNGFHLFLKITFHQDLQKFIAVDLADQRARMVVVGDIGRILGEDVSHDLIDGIVALFLQCTIDRRHDLLDLFVFFLIDVELTRQIYHMDSTFPAGQDAP